MKAFPTINQTNLLRDSLRISRAHLDEINRSNVLAKRKINHLERILTQKRRQFFVYDSPEGIIDSSRFTQIITNPLEQNYYKKSQDGEIKSTSISFVIDSAIFYLQDFSDIISLLDMTIQSFEKSEINTELFYYDAELVKYKDNYDSWFNSKYNISSLLSVDSQYSEKIDEDLDKILKYLILNKSHASEANKILFFITNRAEDIKISSLARTQQVLYQHFNMLELPQDTEVKIAFIKKLSELFNLKI